MSENNVSCLQQIKKANSVIIHPCNSIPIFFILVKFEENLQFLITEKN